jgi:ATP-dependent DNA helicase RecG
MTERTFLSSVQKELGTERRAILDMIRLCRTAGVRAPEFRQDGGQFVQTLWRPASAASERVEAHEAHDEAHDPISWSERRIMAACLAAPRSTVELLATLGYTMRTGNFKRGLKKLLALHLLEMSMPDSPRSKNQMYRLTDKGRAWLAAQSTTGGQS